MSKKWHRRRQTKQTNEKCEGFVNANCSYDCPNAKLESACDRWDLDPSDFGMEYTTSRESIYSDTVCSCDDCLMQDIKDYYPRSRP